MVQPSLFFNRTYLDGSVVELFLALWEEVLVVFSLVPEPVAVALRYAETCAKRFGFASGLIQYVSNLLEVFENLPETIVDGEVYTKYDFISSLGQGEVYWTSDRDYYKRSCSFYPLLLPHLNASVFPPGIGLSVTFGILLTYADNPAYDSIPWLSPYYRNRELGRPYRVLWPENPEQTSRQPLTIAIRWQAPGNYWYYYCNPLFYSQWVGDVSGRSGTFFEPDGSSYVVGVSPTAGVFGLDFSMSSGTGICESPWAVSWKDDPYFQPGGDNEHFHKVAGGGGYWEWKAQNSGFPCPTGVGGVPLPAYIAFPPYPGGSGGETGCNAVLSGLLSAYAFISDRTFIEGGDGRQVTVSGDGETFDALGVSGDGENLEGVLL